MESVDDEDEGDECMNLKRAHEVAVRWRELSKQIIIDIPAQAAIILDDRVAELEADVSRLATMSIEKNTENSSLILKVAEFEAQRDELKAKVKSLTQMVRRREANIDAIERIARDSDKEKLEEKMHADLMNELEI